MPKPAAGRRARIACVLLAAGGSSRLGRPKQLVRRRARPLTLHALDAARAAGAAPLIVVVGADGLRMRALVRRSGGIAVRAVANPRWHNGLATSLQVGLAALPRGVDAVLVLLVDQPDVDARALRRLCDAWRRQPGVAAAAYYDRRPGVPAILPRKTWSSVRGLHGDVGARALLRASAKLTLVSMPEAAFDVDTPADLARL